MACSSKNLFWKIFGKRSKAHPNGNPPYFQSRWKPRLSSSRRKFSFFFFCFMLVCVVTSCSASDVELRPGYVTPCSASDVKLRPGYVNNGHVKFDTSFWRVLWYVVVWYIRWLPSSWLVEIPIASLNDVKIYLKRLRCNMSFQDTYLYINLVHLNIYRILKLFNSESLFSEETFQPLSTWSYINF